MRNTSIYLKLVDMRRRGRLSQIQAVGAAVFPSSAAQSSITVRFTRLDPPRIHPRCWECLVLIGASIRQEFTQKSAV
jgi:hypothetical protein